MKPYAFAAAFGAITLATFSQVWAAGPIPCPDISEAIQIGACPTEEELQVMFKNGCGAERAPGAKNPELCDSYAEFKRRKNTALWESADGEFMGYLSCTIPASKIRSARPVSVAISHKDGLNTVSCIYQGGIKFALRTRSVCRIPGVTNSNVVMQTECGSDMTACKVECD